MTASKAPTPTGSLPLLAAYRAGDEDAGERFVTANIPLVYHLADRMADRGAPREDLVECGTVGLVKAMKTFDFSRGVAFSTYAVPLILGEMRRFLRDDGIVKVSREERRLCACLHAERERRTALGLPVDIGSLAEAVGVSRSDAACALFALTPPRSLDERAYDDEDSPSLGATLADEDEVRAVTDRLALRMALERLPLLQRRIVFLRYFCDLTQSEVARRLGLSQVKVSREERRILEFLRSHL